jgi:hypothetical protein
MINVCHSELFLVFSFGNCSAFLIRFQNNKNLMKPLTKNLGSCDAVHYVINRIVSQHYKRDNKLTKKATKLGS